MRSSCFASNSHTGRAALAERSGSDDLTLARRDLPLGSCCFFAAQAAPREAPQQGCRGGLVLCRRYVMYLSVEAEPIFNVVLRSSLERRSDMRDNDPDWIAQTARRAIGSFVDGAPLNLWLATLYLPIWLLPVSWAHSSSWPNASPQPTLTFERGSGLLGYHGRSASRNSLVAKR